MLSMAMASVERGVMPVMYRRRLSGLCSGS